MKEKKKAYKPDFLGKVRETDTTNHKDRWLKKALDEATVRKPIPKPL